MLSVASQDQINGSSRNGSDDVASGGDLSGDGGVLKSENHTGLNKVEYVTKIQKVYDILA